MAPGPSAELVLPNHPVTQLGRQRPLDYTILTKLYLPVLFKSKVLVTGIATG